MASRLVTASASLVVAGSAICLPGCREASRAPAVPEGRPAVFTAAHTVRPAPAAAAAAAQQVEVPPAPFSEGVFPCSDCHAQPDLPPNRTRRTLVDAHDEIVLKHDERQRWCLDCHDGNDRDQLHLASGDLVPFAESYRVCGQCHGEKYRDWRAGVHGRRTGSWNGRKEYLLCVHCHDPHAPRFKTIAPKPAPVRPTWTAR